MRPFPKNISDGGFYYTNDGSDIHLSRPVTAGDLLTPGESKPMFEEVTIPGSECREWIMGGIGTLVDEEGKQVVSFRTNTRECWKKRADSGEPISFYDNMTEWCGHFPPAHVTTNEDWAKIRVHYCRTGNFRRTGRRRKARGQPLLHRAARYGYRRAGLLQRLHPAHL